MVAVVEYQCWRRRRKNAAVVATAIDRESATGLAAAVDRENATALAAAMNRESVTGVVAMDRGHAGGMRWVARLRAYLTCNDLGDGR